MLSPNDRILVVDDANTVRKLITMTLKKMGYTDLIEAGDGEKAWSALADSAVPVKLILSDLNMPLCSGLEFLKRVRAASLYTDIPFIMITAEAQEKEMTDALTAGANGYILKPINPEILRARLEEIWKTIFKAA
jgi:two-component system chemotaxis response regulator CheY